MTIAPASQARPDRTRALPFNPFQIALRDDPYPEYRALREQCPVYWVRGCLGRDWILSSHAEVQRTLMDPRCDVDDLPTRIRALTSSDASDAAATLARTLDTWLFFVSGERHRHLQRLVAPYFTPAAVAQRRRAVRARAEQLLDAVAADGRADLMTCFARRLPFLVSNDLLGTDFHDSSALLQLAQDMFSVFTVPTPVRRYRELGEHARTLRAQLLRVLVAKRATPANDLATTLVEQIAHGELSEHEALALGTMILSVGQDTTQHLIGNAVDALLEHPEQLALLRVQPELMPLAVKELARFNTPVQVIVHVARAQIELAGETIAPGERIHFYLAAAHRDPAAFDAPDRLDLTRKNQSRLLFGAGPHFCLGAHLALLTGEEALATLLERFPRLRRAPGAPRRAIKSLHMRGLASLPIQWS